MPEANQIRADYDASTITMYQAYSTAIALPALKSQRFAPPFSLTRMTWIKPSFLWLMERSNWAQKSSQECILAVRIKRTGWEKALELGVLTGYEPGVHQSNSAWNQEFEKAIVHVQWDPERSLRGADLGINSIQVGLGRTIIEEYVNDWVTEIKDYTPLVRKIHGFLKSGQAEKAKKLLPPERTYPVSSSIAKRLNMKS